LSEPESYIACSRLEEEEEEEEEDSRFVDLFPLPCVLCLPCQFLPLRIEVRKTFRHEYNH
jgi:hypothetical protein